MDGLSLVVDPAWTGGLLLAMTRVGAFVVAASALLAFLPGVGRLALVLVLGLFLTEPVVGIGSVEGLVGAAVVNAVVGVVLGTLAGLLFHLFAVAGGILDVTANLSAATVFDPTRGEQGAILSRLLHLTGLALFVVGGGLGLLVTALAASVRAVPLTGTPRLGGDLVAAMVEGTSRLLVVAIEVAMPVLAVLIVTELVLGIAARFAPQANVFLIGMPLKVLVAVLATSAVVALLPQAVDGYVQAMEGTVNAVLRSMGG